MMTPEMAEALAKEIAVVAAFLRERQFSFCLCSGDMTADEKDDFIKAFTESLESGYAAHHHRPSTQIVSD